MKFAQLQGALHVFGLRERAMLKEIKARYRKLVKQYHPDAGECLNQVMIRQVNDAYRVLLEYTGSYRYSFTEEEFCEQYPEERIRRQFKEDPLWG
jgi:DnaJ-class molecular chaperone